MLQVYILVYVHWCLALPLQPHSLFLLRTHLLPFSLLCPLPYPLQPPPHYPLFNKTQHLPPTVDIMNLQGELKKSIPLLGPQDDTDGNCGVFATGIRTSHLGFPREPDTAVTKPTRIDFFSREKFLARTVHIAGGPNFTIFVMGTYSRYFHLSVSLSVCLSLSHFTPTSHTSLTTHTLPLHNRQRLRVHVWCQLAVFHFCEWTGYEQNFISPYAH